MSCPTGSVAERATDGKDSRHDEKLRDEIIESEKSQADFLKWKLVALAGIASVSLGFGSANSVPKGAALLVCLIPVICLYVDLISLHIMIRIITIGIYLKISGSRYEQLAFELRDRTFANPFAFEAGVLHGSSLFFNIIIVALGFIFPHALSNWPSEYGQAYAVSGVLGIVATIILWMTYRSRAKEITRVAQETLHT
jgi:energy-converting hydrogenase Eha subunit C